jgi:hypothetical protein
MSTWDSHAQREALLTRLPKRSRSRCVEKASSERDAGVAAEVKVFRRLLMIGSLKHTSLTYFNSVLYILTRGNPCSARQSFCLR